MKDSFDLTLACWKYGVEQVEFDERGVVMAVYHENKVSRKFQKGGWQRISSRRLTAFSLAAHKGREYLLNKSSRGIPSEALVLGGAWFGPSGGHREGLLCSSAIVGNGRKRINRRWDD